MTGASQVCSLAFHSEPGPLQLTGLDPSPGVKLKLTGDAVAFPHTAPAVTVLLTGCHVAGSVQNQVFALTMVYGCPSVFKTPDGYLDGTGDGITNCPQAANASWADVGGGGAAGAAGAPAAATGTAAGGCDTLHTTAAAAGHGAVNPPAPGVTFPGKNGLLLTLDPPW